MASPTSSTAYHLVSLQARDTAMESAVPRDIRVEEHDEKVIRARGESKRERTRESRMSYRKLATSTEKIYMTVAASEALVVFAVAFTAFGLIQVNIETPGPKTKTVPVYLSNFIFAQIFSLLYVFDALRARNIVQLGLHLCFQFCIWLYSVLQIPQTANAFKGTPQDLCGSFERCTGPHSLFNMIKKLYIVTPIVIGVCSIVFAVLVHRLHVQFGWAVFYLVGASPDVKRYHREYQSLISLLKLLFFFATAFCIAYLVLVATETSMTAEFVVTIIAIVLVPFVMLACGWALRKENKSLMAICLVFMVAGLAYFIYKLASMFLPSTENLYINTKITMTIFSVFAILILMATFSYGVICFSNFGKGLMETHHHPDNRTSLWTLGQPRFPRKGGPQDEDGHWSGEGPDGPAHRRQEPFVID
ncbi:hypothetical protein BD324DRAFT_7537 [Kockovaella imperatae]|uniref:DUF7789 domain-containing protein n=1 Tax=Kockovaella imperatae TaxID=4999 RepID=A0A1Y1UTN7_9TREE|nr:hypothetical protein BD324DRAFT_7537 [Kockovaella imperatae]ORX40555.1 hypothetical protein BD324DRAFT_7537 [Kockovaella imperatae]